MHTVGVQRQYTGTAGRIENAQVAVHLTYAARRGHAFIDRALYLPRSWVDDPARCRAAGVPDGVEFATKPALATAMIRRAMQAGVPAAWVAGDEVYGADPMLRRTVRDLGLGYVLQISANRRVPTHAGLFRVDTLAGTAPLTGWQHYSCGPGSKGPGFYAWTWIALLPEDDHDTGQHHLLIRRNDATGELAYRRCYSPRPVPLPTLVRVAGQRWRIEESFQAAKSLVGLDQHQLRRWTSWHRWTTLAMLAHAFLAVATAIERDHTPAPDGLIELTVNEFRHLFDALLLSPTHTVEHLLAWSQWRRRHQATVLSALPAIHPVSGYWIAPTAPYRSGSIHEIRYHASQLGSAAGGLDGLIYTGLLTAGGGFEDRLYARPDTDVGQVHARPAIATVTIAGNRVVAWEVAPGTIAYLGYSGAEFAPQTVDVLRELAGRARPLCGRQWRVSSPQRTEQRNDFG